MNRAAKSTGSRGIEPHREANRAARNDRRVAEAADECESAGKGCAVKARNKKVAIAHIVDNERVGDRRTDERSAKIEDVAAD